MGTLSYNTTIQNGDKIKVGPVNDNFSAALEQINGNLDENNIKSTTSLTVTTLKPSTTITATQIESTSDITITSTGTDFDIYDNLATAICNIDITNGTALTSDFVESPIGTIEFFSGSWTDNSTKLGWYKCDGNNGTIDLADYFVRGSATCGNTGGNDDALTPEHNHTVSTETESASHTHSLSLEADSYAYPSHNHTIWLTDFDVPFISIANSTTASGTNNKTTQGTYSGASLYDHEHTFTFAVTGDSADHTHALTVDNAGSSEVNSNMPAYYTLIPIMRIS